MAAEQQTTEVLRRNETGDVKGKIIEYTWWMKKDGKSDSTILGRSKLLRILVERGANLYDPETVKNDNSQTNLGATAEKTTQSTPTPLS